tara:strand:+ start:16 stop:780 length:765 start_codon:yes stop_codon:yes gene_type:complete
MKEFEKLARIEPKAHLTEYFRAFAEYVYRNWYIQTIDSSFEIYETEFLLQTQSDIHNDPNIDDSINQRQLANWWITEGGINITFGCEDYAASIFIRSLKDRNTGEMIIGPQRCFNALFRNAGNVITPNPQPRFFKKDQPEEIELRNVPRAQLPAEERSSNRANRLKYLFRPYRFIRMDMDDFPEKYLAMLYTDKIAKLDIDLKLENKIYNKYLDSYDKGYYAIDLDVVWNVSSRSHRMAVLMGYLHRNQEADVV